MDDHSKPRLHTVPGWPYPWPTQAGLRHLIFHANTNGFHTVIRRVGRRVLIDDAAFHEWINRGGRGK